MGVCGAHYEWAGGLASELRREDSGFNSIPIAAEIGALRGGLGPTDSRYIPGSSRRNMWSVMVISAAY